MVYFTDTNEVFMYREGMRDEVGKVMPVGGSVITKPGSFRCNMGHVCSINVYDIHFDEEFQAVPAEGYLFAGWKKRDSGLYGGNFSDDYLGCLNCSRSHAESVCNANGQYGSERSSDSIWNPYGDFGSRYSSFSPWNRYLGTPPAIYDLHRVFWGYLTANPSEPNRTRIALLVQLADYGGNDRNTLGAVRNWFCQ